MSYHHRYKQREFHFAHLLVNLRRSAGLIQEEVALHLGVSAKTIRNWEGGSNYPTEEHLQKLIELYLDQDGFEPGREREDVHALWEQFQKSAHRPASLFNEPWFASVLNHYQSRRTAPGSHYPPARTFWVREPTHPSGLTGREPGTPSISSEQKPSSLPSREQHREDWGEALDVSSFTGRAHELELLSTWVLHEKSRLVVVLGMGGIGKTALSTTFAREVASQFAVVIWRSLHHAPAPEEILSDWLRLLVDSSNQTIPQDLDQQISLLLDHLRVQRCLLVLDNVETLFQGRERAGSYRPGYEHYRPLFLRLGTSQHQSCLLLTSRSRLAELDLLGARQAPMRVLNLAGLAWEESRAILSEEGLFASAESWQELSERYAGNPLALKIVAGEVRDLFGGDLSAFLRAGHLTFQGIRVLLHEQVESLSALEQELLYWLAIERDLASLERLQANLMRQVPVGQVLEALSSLQRHSLIERGEQGAVFTLQPVVQEYLTDRLAEQVSQEILNLRPVVMLRYALLQAAAKDYVRQSQRQLLLQAVLDRLLLHLQDKQSVQQRLDQLLMLLRTLPMEEQGYGGGNVVNLLARLFGHLVGKDCSHLVIRQADLQETNAQDTSFVGCDLSGSVFLETINGVMCVALSPNGLYIAGGSTNGEIRVWRVSDGQPMLSLAGHDGLVWSLAFNPQSRLLASGGYDGLVKLWDLGTGQCLHILQGHTAWIRSVAFHPSGRLLATCSDDGSIQLWDLSTALCIQVWHRREGGVFSLAMSPDGRLLAGSYADSVITLWDLQDQQCLWSSVTHQTSGSDRQYGLLSLAFSPDGELLVSGGEDGKIRVWEASSGKLLATLSGHTDLVYSVSFPAPGLLASGSFDGTVKLWQIGRTPEATHFLSTLQEHTHWISSISCGPFGLLVSGSRDGVIKLWQVNQQGVGKCLKTVRGYSCQISAVALSPDGRLLVSSENNGAVRLWETESGKVLHVLSRLTSESYGQAFSPDGRFFAKSAAGNTIDDVIQIWEVETWRCVKTLKGQQGYTWSLTFSPDGLFLLSGSVDTTIRRWEVESGRCLTSFLGHRSWIWSLACSPDGQLLASGDRDGVVKLWQISTGECLYTLQGSQEAIVALGFTPDSQTLLSSNEQDLLTLWDVESGERKKTLPGIGESYWLGSVALSADGSWLAATSRDQTITIWDVSKGERVYTFPVRASQPRSVAWSADGRRLACGTDDGSILLWDRRSGMSLQTLRSERPYERMNIRGVSGITEAQRASLKTLGAIEKEVRRE